MNKKTVNKYQTKVENIGKITEDGKVKVPLEAMSDTFVSKSERTTIIIILLDLKGRRPENEKAGESVEKVAGRNKEEEAAILE